MLHPRIIPNLLIHNGALVKTVQFSNPKYIGDPINSVRIFNEKKADEILIFDIDASIQNTEPSEISKPTNWHRDVSHLNGEFQKLLYPQLIIYLTNVDENTHCFSLSPEPQGNQISSTEIQLQKHGVYNFYGQAGDAILLNSNCLHGLTLRKTKIERRILQIYYSHPSSPEVGDNTIIPPRLWRDNPDPRIRRFFGKHNSYSKLVNQAMGLEIK